MVKEDIIEDPISVEEPGTFISNLVITDKKRLRSHTGYPRLSSSQQRNISYA